MPRSCRADALMFLKIRPRSVEELRSKLIRKKHSLQDIQATIEYLESIRLLDDRAFTASWIQYRLARPFGFKRIITELKAKGIKDDIIEESVSHARGEYVEGDVILQLAQRRWQRFPRLEPAKKKKRVFDYLIRRGFSIDAVMKALKNIC